MKVLDAYEAIRKDLRQEDRGNKDYRPRLGLYPMEKARFSISARAVTREEAEAAIRGFPAAQGWVCRQSSLDVFPTADARPDPNKGGVILSAELVATDGQRSLHLRQDGMGGWIVTEIAEGDAISAAAIDGLAHTTCLIGDNRVEGWLLYRVYWRHDEDQGYQTCASRLAEIRRDPKHKTKPCKEA